MMYFRFRSTGRIRFFAAALLLVAVACRVAGAAELLLARNAPLDVDPAGYWVSEKLDGVRAYWDGRVLRLRGGGEVRPPPWFTAGFPAVPLDGELWLGRGTFDELSGLVRRLTPVDRDWKRVRYMVFELPAGAGDFTARLYRMRQLIAAAGVPWLHPVEQRRLANRAELASWLKEVVDGGGEGLMLHRADAPYLTGRSEALLKLKPWYDAEATVIGYRPGRGRLAGRIGSLLVRSAAGRVFNLGSGLSDRQRERPPAIGSEVSYRYRALTPAGRPLFPVFWRVRRPAPQSMPGNSGVGASSTSP